MSIYHFSSQVIGRTAGRSSVAASAYRAGIDLVDERTGQRHNYSKRSGVDLTIILAPSNSPKWVFEREQLWNQVESVEKRKDAQLAREINIALPNELSHDEKRTLMLDYVQSEFVNAGMVADVAFHDFDSNNAHAHIMLSTRNIGADGFEGKNRDWNEKALLEKWREQWAVSANLALERAGIEERIDHRSLKTQQAEAVALGDVSRALELERVPQKHNGPSPGADLVGHQLEAKASAQEAKLEAKLYLVSKTQVQTQKVQVQTEQQREQARWIKEAIQKHAGVKSDYEEKVKKLEELRAQDDRLKQQAEALALKIENENLAKERLLVESTARNDLVQNWKRTHFFRVKLGFTKQLDELRKLRDEVNAKGRESKTWIDDKTTELRNIERRFVQKEALKQSAEEVAKAKDGLRWASAIVSKAKRGFGQQEVLASLEKSRDKLEHEEKQRLRASFAEQEKQKFSKQQKTQEQKHTRGLGLSR
jgi:hypothetical protein